MLKQKDSTKIDTVLNDSLAGLSIAHRTLLENSPNAQLASLVWVDAETLRHALSRTMGPRGKWVNDDLYAHTDQFDLFNFVTKTITLVVGTEHTHLIATGPIEDSVDHLINIYTEVANILGVEIEDADITTKDAVAPKSSAISKGTLTQAIRPHLLFADDELALSATGAQIVAAVKSAKNVYTIPGQSRVISGVTLYTNGSSGEIKQSVEIKLRQGDEDYTLYLPDTNVPVYANFLNSNLDESTINSIVRFLRAIKVMLDNAGETDASDSIDYSTKEKMPPRQGQGPKKSKASISGLLLDYVEEPSYLESLNVKIGTLYGRLVEHGFTFKTSEVEMLIDMSDDAGNLEIRTSSWTLEYDRDVQVRNTTLYTAFAHIDPDNVDDLANIAAVLEAVSILMQ